MKTTVDARLRDEARRLHLRFACEDCVHFAWSSADGGAAGGPAGACTHGYPASPRRADLDGAALVFCKEFELGAP